MRNVKKGEKRFGYYFIVSVVCIYFSIAFGAVLLSFSLFLHARLKCHIAWLFNTQLHIHTRTHETHILTQPADRLSNLHEAPICVRHTEAYRHRTESRTNTYNWNDYSPPLWKLFALLIFIQSPHIFRIENPHIAGTPNSCRLFFMWHMKRDSETSVLCMLWWLYDHFTTRVTQEFNECMYSYAKRHVCVNSLQTTTSSHRERIESTKVII